MLYTTRNILIYLFITICSCNNLDFCNNLIDRNIVNNSQLQKINDVISNGDYKRITGDKVVISILSKNNSNIKHPLSNAFINDYYKRMEKCYNNKKLSFMSILLINGSQFSLHSLRHDRKIYKNYKTKLFKYIKSGNYFEFVKCLDIISADTYKYHEYMKGKLATFFTTIFLLIFTLFPNICIKTNNNKNIPLMDRMGRIYRNDIQEKKQNKFWYNISQFFYRLHPYTHRYNSDNCPICLCEWSSENIIVLPCYHKYHYDCLKQSMTNNVCPLCKKNHSIEL